MLSRWKSKDKSEKSSKSSGKKKRKGRDNEDWHGDGRMDGGLSDGEASRGPTRSRSSRRDDPRRHTLASNNHLYMHPHHHSQHNAHDLEPPSLRGYPPNNNFLYDDDPGIMSEVETASTGFRRGGKQRSSLPVVRTPSKTLERPLGLVFLQYRNETKRALLPNEITSIDTVKALFVRSFPKQLTMQYMDSPMVKIYIHDSSKDMFYELEDDRVTLREIRDRSVLRLFEANDIAGEAFPDRLGVSSISITMPTAVPAGPSNWDQDLTYFSEPEIDADYHQHNVHKSKAKPQAYYMGNQPPNTLPRSGPPLNDFSPSVSPASSANPNQGAGCTPAKPMRTYIPGSGSDRCFPFAAGDCPRAEQLYTIPDGYMSSPERSAARAPYEDPYYAQFVNSTAGRPVNTPVIDEENMDAVIDDSYQMYGTVAAPRPVPRPQFETRTTPKVEELQRIRVEKMERQLANLTGLVHKALKTPGATVTPPAVAPRQDINYQRTGPERDRLKPAPPPKPAGLSAQQLTAVPLKTIGIHVPSDYFIKVRSLQKQSHDLRIETNSLRRSTLGHAVEIRQMMGNTIVEIGNMAEAYAETASDVTPAYREEEIYRQEMLMLENDLYELEATVERLRGQAANRYKETRVNMADIERIAMVLSKSSKTVADWKIKFPALQENLKGKLAAEMDKVVRKEKLLEDEPERLELALRRCKKLTGTLVTLKRLACVQEQRLPQSDGRLSPDSSQGSTSCLVGPDDFAETPKVHNNKGGNGCSGRAPRGGDLRPENALDALLDELQTFAKPGGAGATGVGGRGGAGDGGLRRLASYPSGSDTDASPPVRARGQHPPKPPVPERHPELVALAGAGRRAPPPPPPRTSSRSPLASPPEEAGARQALLEMRHQELLAKQRALQYQYARLQMIQRSGSALPPSAQPDLKKTGSESNLLTKMNLNLAITGSMSQISVNNDAYSSRASDDNDNQPVKDTVSINKVYETDII